MLVFQALSAFNWESKPKQTRPIYSTGQVSDLIIWIADFKVQVIGFSKEDSSGISIKIASWIRRNKNQGGTI